VNREVLDVENLQPLEHYVESVWADAFTPSVDPARRFANFEYFE
jgi:hypothetical protein